LAPDVFAARGVNAVVPDDAGAIVGNLGVQALQAAHTHNAVAVAVHALVVLIAILCNWN